MKNLSINFLTESTPHEAAHVPQILDAHATEWHTIGCCNWAETYPYKPKAEFRLACTDETLLLHYRVEEDSVLAHYGEDNGKVWTDSCVEMFLSPDGNTTYYNIECNCIGTILLGYHGEEDAKEQASAEVLSTIGRWSTLGRTPFEERREPTHWEVALIVPYTALWHHQFRLQPGTSLTANFYKCGDNLQKPHFLSWAPIKWEKPNFHLPGQFGRLSIDNLSV